MCERRAYESQSGKLREFLALYERDGRPLERKHCCDAVGFFSIPGIGGANDIAASCRT
jgi:hypothetical protein